MGKMFKEIMDYIIKMRAEWIIALLVTVAGAGYRRILKAIERDRKKNEAVAEGVEALLRDRIIDSFHKYEEKGICPVYAKENIKRLYVPYHKLGGNDIATEFVEKLLRMPTGGK